MLREAYTTNNNTVKDILYALPAIAGHHVFWRSFGSSQTIAMEITNEDDRPYRGNSLFTRVVIAEHKIKHPVFTSVGLPSILFGSTCVFVPKGPIAGIYNDNVSDSGSAKVVELENYSKFSGSLPTVTPGPTGSTEVIFDAKSYYLVGVVALARALEVRNLQRFTLSLSTYNDVLQALRQVFPGR